MSRGKPAEVQGRDDELCASTSLIFDQDELACRRHGPGRDDLSSNCHFALHSRLSMIMPAPTWISRCRQRRAVFVFAAGPSVHGLRRLHGVQQTRHLVAQRGDVFRQLAGRAQHVLGGPARGVDRLCDGVDVAGDIRRAGRRLADGACWDPVRKAEMPRSAIAREN